MLYKLEDEKVVAVGGPTAVLILMAMIMSFPESESNLLWCPLTTHARENLHDACDTATTLCCMKKCAKREIFVDFHV
jgi:hypothetical protein